MKVLVIGNGGREHSLVWKFLNEEEVSKVYCAPGNCGMQGVERINLSSHQELAQFAKDNAIDLTVVGPEQPLCEGIVDVFRTQGLAIFGADKRSAILEGSKDYAKQFMFKYGIPTAQSKTFTNKESALKYLEGQVAPIVIKADGLAAGKGVTVASEMSKAIKAVEDCFAGVFGQAGHKVVIEEFLDGEEASLFAFLDGEIIKPLVSSQDHKRAYDQDKGPNTGGMGAYSPAPVVTDELMKEIDESILNPILKGVQEEGLDYRGVIFIGLMIGKRGAKVLEFNVRFGDPETQVVLMRMKSSLSQAMSMTVERKLSDFDFKWYDSKACCVVMASGGYPASYEKGFPISGLAQASNLDDVTIFNAGTSLNDKQEIVNTGGRVLGVTARGKSIKQAVDLAYKAVDLISLGKIVFIAKI